MVQGFVASSKFDLGSGVYIASSRCSVCCSSVASTSPQRFRGLWVQWFLDITVIVSGFRPIGTVTVGVACVALRWRAQVLGGVKVCGFRGFQGVVIILCTTSKY